MPEDKVPDRLWFAHMRMPEHTVLRAEESVESRLWFTFDQIRVGLQADITGENVQQIVRIVLDLDGGALELLRAWIDVQQLLERLFADRREDLDVMIDAMEGSDRFRQAGLCRIPEPLFR